MKVLDALLSTSDKELAGSQIAKVTGLQSGTLYPILLRLEEAGWLSSHWERSSAKSLGRPRRRYYSVTALGARGARAEAKRLAPLIGRLAWA